MTTPSGKSGLRCRRVRFAVVLACLGVASSARADDDPLAEARNAVEMLKYPVARTALAKALASGAYGPDDLAEIYRLSGMVEASLGHSGAATQAFSRLLVLAPSSKLDPGTSPKITKPFAAAVAFYKSHDRLRVKAETATEPPSLTLVVQSDPLGMVSGASVTVVTEGGASETLDGTGSKRITISLPSAKRLELRVAAVDERGNRLIELGSASEPIVIVPSEKAKPEEPAIKSARPENKPERTTPPPPPRPFYARWPLWAGVSVAMLAAGTYFGFEARSAGDDLNTVFAHSSQHDYGEASNLESTIRRDALIANIGFGLAGAAALASGVLYLLEPRAEKSVAAVPTRGGAAIAVQVRF